MGWRIKKGRGVLTLGASLVLVLALGVLAGCGSGSPSPPPSPEEAEEVVVRVSGTEGVAYSGDYTTLAAEPQDVNATLEGEPTDYAVTIEPGVADGVTAFFRKTEPGEGELRAQILADGEVVTESATYAEFGSIIVDWLPEAGPLDGDLSEGDLAPEGELPEEFPSEEKETP